MHNPTVEELVIGIGNCIIEECTLARQRAKALDGSDLGDECDHIGKGGENK